MSVTHILQGISVLSEVVLAIFTIVLAGVTYMYYIQSEKQAKEISRQTTEMEKSRELNQEPKLKAGVKPDGPNFHVAFVNIGGGIAQDVKAKYWVEGVKEHSREWGTQVHYPGDMYNIGFPLDDSPVGEVGMTDKFKSILEGKDDTFVVEWQYKDSTGKLHTHVDEFSVFEQIEDRSESTAFYYGKEREVRF